MAGTSAEFTGKVGPHTVQRTPGSDLPSALSCIDPDWSPVPPIHPGHSPTVHRHHRYLVAAKLWLVHGFGVSQRPRRHRCLIETARQRTLEAGRLGTPVGGVRLGCRRRRPRHPGVVDRYWAVDSGRRRGYLPDWRRGRLHRIHPGLPGASKAATLVLAAQVGAHARRYPRPVVRRTSGEGSRRCSSEPDAHLLLHGYRWCASPLTPCPLKPVRRGATALEG